MQAESCENATNKRPKLMMEAARIGAVHYRRHKHLSRILGNSHPNNSDEILMRLTILEVEMNDLRIKQDARYALTRHLEVLIACWAEKNAAREVAHDVSSKALRLVR